MILVALFAAGIFAWTFLEYVIHGWMSHVFETFATPLHAGHHKEPRAVFTVGAWIPTLVAWLLGMMLLGWGSAMAFVSGVICGFIGYELFHYRIHFSLPASALESRLRARHLIHHLHRSHACFGVSTGLWDRAFGSDISNEELRELMPRVASIPPLRGPSNARLILQFDRWLGSRG